MEDKLFKFEGCDGDATLMRYYDITLKEKIGEFESGTQIDYATINYENSQLSFYRSNPNSFAGSVSVLIGRYQLELAVTKDLLNDE